MAEQLSQSMEDYLEAILRISADKKVVRVRDLASEQGVSMASVSGAMKKLEKQNLVTHGKYDFIELTSSGTKAATEVARRHSILKNFFIYVVGVDPKTADDDACAIEHHISRKSIKGISDLLASAKEAFDDKGNLSI